MTQKQENVLLFCQPKERIGSIPLRVGSYWAFRNAMKSGEDTDMAMFRLLRERTHYRRWSYILAMTTAFACVLAVL